MMHEHVCKMMHQSTHTTCMHMYARSCTRACSPRKGKRQTYAVLGCSAQLFRLWLGERGLACLAAHPPLIALPPSPHHLSAVLNLSRAHTCTCQRSVRIPSAPVLAGASRCWWAVVSHVPLISDVPRKRHDLPVVPAFNLSVWASAYRTETSCPILGLSLIDPRPCPISASATDYLGQLWRGTVVAAWPTRGSARTSGSTPTRPVHLRATEGQGQLRLLGANAASFRKGWL